MGLLALVLGNRTIGLILSFSLLPFNLLSSILDLPSSISPPRQLRNILILRLTLLPCHNFFNMSPGLPKTVRAIRHLVTDSLMQRAQTVARHGRIHMVFGVIIHMPVKKLDKRVEIDGPTTQPEIRHVVRQTNVLS